MITIVKYYGCGRVDVYGLSSDEKPQEVAGIPVSNASVFYEMDTQKVFAFDEENSQWLPQ